MSDAINGKTMGNLRNRVDVRLVNNKRGYLKCTSKPSCMSRKIFNNNLVAIHKSKVSLERSKPAYTGVCILELSKIFYYDDIKNEYNNKSKLLFTDTESLMYETKTEDVYEDFSRDKGMFDFSNYWTKSNYCDDSNKLVIGKMKDENGGVAIEEFV